MTTRDNTRDNTRDKAGDDIETEPTPLELAWSRHISTESALLDTLITRHRERQRRYHKVGHVEAVIGHVSQLADDESVADLGAVIAAAFYHDAIYEPTHPANERASARLARRDLESVGWEPTRIEAVATMIEGTKGHANPPDTDTAVLYDADLAILGAATEAYDDYVTKTRAEYNHLDDAEWRTGRAAFLESLLGRDQLFATETGRSLWEAAARSNVSAELDVLRR